MSWSRSRAMGRIQREQELAPEVTVERYADEYLRRLDLIRSAARLRRDYAAAEVPPLFNLPNGAAVLVDTVQLYVRALSYDEVRLEGGRETELSQARGLAFLHLLYGASDRVVEKAGGQRVDHHGARMHAVVIEPRGDANVFDRIATAFALAEEMMELARLAGQQFLGKWDLPLRFRVGIDVGPCIAINSGRSDEPEPMFIGPAANHAAKLADGDQEGVYLSSRVRSLLRLQPTNNLFEERARPASMLEQARIRASSLNARNAAEVARARMDDWLLEEAQQGAVQLRPEDFSFHHHTPPLRSINYANLMPSSSIRMPLVSIYADLDRYTAYIDHCLANDCLPEAVKLLHILRSEFNAVVHEDFSGRKVRFIGDCIHAVLAEGTPTTTDEMASVVVAAKCVGGLRSSFLLCQELLPEARKLGLAIGFELGMTPVTRIGIRGPRSVRAATSLAVRSSEECQQACTGEQTMIGDRAYAAAPAALRHLFGPTRKSSGLTFDDVATQLEPSKVAARVVQGSAGILSGAAMASPARAYTK